MHVPQRSIRKFLPKGSYVGKLSGGIKVTRAVPPEKTPNPGRTRAFFERYGITDFTAKPMKPLPPKEEVALRKMDKVLSSPKPVFSGRGILGAFVDFVKKRGTEEITVVPGFGSDEAYRRAGFHFHSFERGTDMPIWMWRKKK